MIFVEVEHPTKEGVRVLLCADNNDGLPELKHFYVERKHPIEGWRRTKKIPVEKFSKYMKRFGFDELEAKFQLEEFAEKMKDEG